MNPNDIWAVPPAETEGDATIEAIFASVGRSLSRWEWLEAHMSVLFAYLVNPEDGSEPARRAYGAIATFSGRADMLIHAAQGRMGHQPERAPLLASLKTHVELLRRASGRRNEIAHGIAQSVYVQISSPTYLLYPAWYNSRKHQPSRAPSYAYSSATINRFGRQFMELVDPVMALLDGVRRPQPHAAQDELPPRPQ